MSTAEQHDIPQHILARSAEAICQMLDLLSSLLVTRHHWRRRTKVLFAVNSAILSAHASKLRVMGPSSNAQLATLDEILASLDAAKTALLILYSDLKSVGQGSRGKYKAGTRKAPSRLWRSFARRSGVHDSAEAMLSELEQKRIALEGMRLTLISLAKSSEQSSTMTIAFAEPADSTLPANSSDAQPLVEVPNFPGYVIEDARSRETLSTHFLSVADTPGYEHSPFESTLMEQPERVGRRQWPFRRHA